MSEMIAPQPGPSSRPTSHEASGSTRPPDAFSVDTGLIPQAALEEQGELGRLGLSVFNQDVFEQRIMDQVDGALAIEEESRLRKILQKELITITDDITLAKKDLDRVNKAEESLEDLSNKSREIQNQLNSIRKSKENKVKQLKTLKVRRVNVLKKLNFDENAEGGENGEEETTFDKAFQLKKKPKKESEQERMIRTGEMTPFGTLVKTNPEPPPAKRPRMSEFEKALGARQSTGAKTKKDFDRYLKKKSTQAQKPKPQEGDEEEETVPELQNSRKSSDSAKKSNRFDERDHRVYDKEPNYNQSKFRRKATHQIEHNFSEDIALSEEEECDRAEESFDDEEDVYEPSQRELRAEETDGSEEGDASADEMVKGDMTNDKRREVSRIRKRKSLLKKPRPLPKYRENDDLEEPSRSKVKRDLSIRREPDDADPEVYNSRLLKQQRIDQKEEKERRLTDRGEIEEEEGEFEGGLRVPAKLWTKLYKYQKTGVRWLWELHCQQAGGIVGDEMGLGKTIQTIAFMAALHTSKVRNVNFPYRGLGPTIIVCPTTVMHQWLQEFHKWWPNFRVAVLHSSGTFTGSVSDLVRSIAKACGVLITSYNTLVIHQELVLRFNWHYVILDEGHKIRNPDAKVTICCKQFRTPHRIVLSGSPIQNNLKELWSLFDFVFPGKLGTLPDFMQHFSIPIVMGGYSNATQIQVETAYRCACVLRDTINPYLIRRMKADVKKSIDLPDKNEQVLFCRLTDEQRDVYTEYLCSRECSAIMQGKFQVFSGLITLRKICNHPDLSTGGPSVFHGTSRPGEPEYEFGFWKRSGKMIVVEALLRLWHTQGHKVLLFTQSKSMLNILEKFALERDYTFLTMDGGTSISARQPLISQYNNDSSIYLFILTTRVGGLGVNLTGADRVIIFDPDWNPSTDIQARERAWRIGQKRQVTIYRLLTSGTIEEKIYHRQIFKTFLTNRVLKDPKQRRLFKSQDMMELFSLGSKDNDEGTETSALFAGTGSDVRVPKKLKYNRFDEIQETKKKEKEHLVQEKSNRKKRSRKIEEDVNGADVIEDIAENQRIDDEREEEAMGLDNAELERMKEFARKLSRKMEVDKKDKEETENSSSEITIKKEIDIKEELIDDPDENERVVFVNSNDTSYFDKSDIQVKIEKSEDCTNDLSQSSINGLLSDKDDVPQQTTSQESSQKVNEVNKWKKHGKSWSIPKKKKKVSSDENMSDNDDSEVFDLWSSEVKEEDTQGSRIGGTHKRATNRKSSNKEKKEIVEWGTQRSEDVQRNEDAHNNESDRESRERKNPKKKKKKKPRNARFEGERIPNLDKHCPLQTKPSSEDKTEVATKQSDKGDSQHDDFVLRELFKKTGIQGAMKHDKIMDGGRPDYAIVEAEADKVARESAAALRRSRQHCAPAISGVPTWTGQHGATVSKPRFGQKKNSALAGKLDRGESSSRGQRAPSIETDTKKKSSKNENKDKLFDGSSSGIISLSTKNGSLTSSDLLSRMQSRKRISTVVDEDEEDLFRPDPKDSVDPKDNELIEDIRNYISFMAAKDGEASTQEIVLNFGKRLPKSDAPKFKAMLNQICDFHSGFWKLKADFR